MSTHHHEKEVFDSAILESEAASSGTASKISFLAVGLLLVASVGLAIAKYPSVPPITVVHPAVGGHGDGHGGGHAGDSHGGSDHSTESHGETADPKAAAH